MSSSNQEQIYGIQLFDDLHNYLPDILYNHDRFNTVHDLLDYIITGVTQVSPYMRGLRQYNIRQSTQRHRPINQIPSHRYIRTTVPDPNIRVRATTIPLSTPNTQTNSTSNSRLPVFNSLLSQFLSPTADINENTSTIDSIDTINIPIYTTQLQSGNSLSSLLNVLLGSTNLGNNFDEPVTIRPTQEQINNATRVQPVPQGFTDNICNICQENYLTTDISRTIIHCNHTFHKNCIDTWFIANVRCPTCRYDIREYNRNT